MSYSSHETEARVCAGMYRLNSNKQCKTRSVWYGLINMSWDMRNKPSYMCRLIEWYQDMHLTKHSQSRFPDKKRMGKQILGQQKWRLIWYMNGLKTNESTDAWVYGYSTRKRSTLSLGQYTTAFHAQVNTSKACAVKNINKGYKIGTFILYQTDKLQQKYFIYTRFILNLSGTASYP
jgi:hypothetical protein